jgi:very-short-patch-repair endonuclease
MTDAEGRLWSRLRAGQLHGYRFRRQVPIGQYIVDFVSFKARLVIEVDGGQHAVAVEQDGQRTTWLKSRGFRVLRFWNNDVLREVDAVVERVREVLLGSLPPP